MALFQRKKEAYEDYMEDDPRCLDAVKMEIVCAVSETGKNMRAAYEQKSGKKIKLVT